MSLLPTRYFRSDELLQNARSHRTVNNLANRKNPGLIVLGSIITLIVFFTMWQKSRAAAPNNGMVFHEAGTIPTPVSPAVPDNRTVPPANPVTPNAGPAVPAPPAPAAEIVVHINGAVKHPGVYHLPPGSRCDDALKAAGGANADANTDALNLASHLEDGSQIHVPTRREQPARDAQNADTLIKHDTAAASAPAAPAAASTVGSPAKGSTASASHRAAHSSGDRGSRSGSGKLAAGSSETVNINTANSETLQKLPGIGPAMADRILDYRKTNGGFKSPEELMQVSGIGAKKYAKMEPFIRVR